MINLPNKIPVFPLSNFIIFPNTSVPLNIFEPRYIKMIDDCMKDSRIIGMIQPKNNKNIPHKRNCQTLKSIHPRWSKRKGKNISSNYK